MKISDFELFFFKKNFAAAILLSKKPNRFFKQYLIKTRLKNYICLNFLKYFTLLQQIVYFLQESVSKRTPIVFFFNEYWLHPLYFEIAHRCNEYVSYMPMAASSLKSWNPNILIGSEHNNFSFPHIYKTGIAISLANDVDLNLFLTILSAGWPCVLAQYADLQEYIVSKTLNFAGSTYMIPRAATLSIQETYFFLSFFTQIILIEKYRKLVKRL